MTRQLHKALDEVQRLLMRFTVQQTRHEYAAITLWIAYTHAADSFDFAPRLLLTSAEKRSGKSRTMEVAAKLSANPIMALHATTSALFRSLETPRAVFLDEADAIFGTKLKAEQNEELRALLNAGFQRNFPVVRTVGPTHTPTPFPVFAPVCLAAIGSLPDTVADRAVNIRLRRRKPTEAVEPYRSRRNDPELAAVKTRLSESIADVSGDLLNAYPDSPLEDRLADLWEPLFAVADAAGGEWPDRARLAALHLVGQAQSEDRQQSFGMDLLADLRAVLSSLEGDPVPSTLLIEALKNLEEAQWNEIDLKPARLAKLLRQYSIFPVRTSQARGYRQSALQDAFARYLPIDTEVERVACLEEASSRHERHESQKNAANQVTPKPGSDTSKRHRAPQRAPAG